MRSSEASGAGAFGFRVGKGQDREQVVAPNFAIAAIACLAAGLFVAYDTARTVQLLEVAQYSHFDHLLAPLARAIAALILAAVLILLSIPRQAQDRVDATKFYQLATALPMGMACWTRSGQLIVCNEQYRQHLGTGIANPSYFQAIERLTAGGEMTVLSEDDRSRRIEIAGKSGIFLLIDERPMGDGTFITLVTDITETRRIDATLSSIREQQRLLARRYHEEKLKAEAASRAKTNFLAHLSHDIRTPLNHIIGFAELMQHQAYGPLGDARYAEYIDTIHASGQHLLSSFATILDLAELEGGQKALRQDPVLLDEVLNAVASRFAAQAERSNIRLRIGRPTGAVLRGDRLGLTRMVGNIMDNAMRFTQAGGRVTLAAFAADDGVVIEITDTGIGISEERLAGLSQPFALGDATFTRQGNGPGLGISIARAIAELSGGHLAIDSRPSLGTTVAISLPTEPAAAVLAAA